MLVDHGRVAFRRNVGVCAAPVGLLDPRHIPDDAHDLTCADRRVRPAGVCLVLLEVVPEHAERFVQRVRPSGEYRRCDIRKLVKIKQQLSASFVGVCGAERGSGSVPLYPYTVFASAYCFCFSRLPYRGSIGGLSLFRPACVCTLLSSCHSSFIVLPGFVDIGPHYTEHSERNRR